MANDVTLKDAIALISPHLRGLSSVLLLLRGPTGWQTIERQAFEAGAPAWQVPDDTALDFAASARRPTYLPQGDEGSDFCLLDARSVLYLPLEGKKLLYVSAKSAEAFTREDVEAAWRALTAPTSI